MDRQLLALIIAPPRNALSSTEKLVLCALAMGADASGMVSFSVGDLARLSSLTGRAVQKTIRRLEAKKVLVRMERPQQANFYFVDARRLSAIGA